MSEVIATSTTDITPPTLTKEELRKQKNRDYQREYMKKYYHERSSVDSVYLEKHNKYFHDNYYRITKTLVDYDNIDPMLAMLRQFHQVQTKKINFEDSTKIINDSINATYVDPLLDSNDLKKEREIKIANESK